MLGSATKLFPIKPRIIYYIRHPTCGEQSVNGKVPTDNVIYVKHLLEKQHRS